MLSILVRIATIGVSLLGAGCASLGRLPPPPQAPASGKPHTLDIIGTAPIDKATRERVTRELTALGSENMLTEHLAAMQTVSSAPLIVGNRARLLIDGPRAYEAMFAAITGAREHVNIEMYIFDEAFLGQRKLSDLLIERAGKGIAINILYDAIGSSATPTPFFERLTQAGITLCAFNPLQVTSRTREFLRRDHRKIVLVDGRLGFAGGINFSATYSSSSRRRTEKLLDAVKDGWRDTHIEVEGPAATGMQRLFLDNWMKQKCPDMPERDYLPAARDAGDTLLRLAAASAESRSNEPYLAALSAINAARHSVDLTMAYFSPDAQLEKAVQAAAKRGVRVRLLLSGLSDFSGIVEAGRAHYTRLLKAGVQIFEEQRVLLHAKTLEVDGIWSTVGSANWDWMSFANNDELNVEVIDVGFARQMRRLFEDDLQRAAPVTLAQWRKRSFSRKLRERFWVTWERVL